MTSWLSFLFGTEGSAVRSETWSTGLLVLHAVADGVIAVSLLLIPAALIYLYRQRNYTNPGEAGLVALFIFFILAVGLAHFATLLTTWIPAGGPALPLLGAQTSHVCCIRGNNLPIEGRLLLYTHE